MEEQLDKFEQLLENGLDRICSMNSLMDEILDSPDLDGKWDEFIKDYVADAVDNFNDFPEAAIGFAAYLGMAVAHHWDRDWTHLHKRQYISYYGSRGFDNMDDHICEDILNIDENARKKVSECLLSCTQATLALLDHEGIETQTSYGFFVLVRCYSVMFRIGASLELRRLGYRKEAASQASADSAS